MAKSTVTGHDIARQLLECTKLTRDALPYTPEFDGLYQQYLDKGAEKLAKHEFWRLLSNVAKRGGWKGKRRGEPAPHLTHQQCDELRDLVAGKLGSRDSLVYTDEFDDLLASFNASTGLKLTQREFWRTLCNIGKQSLRPDVQALLEQGIDSLVLGIEHFNRPSEIGRQASVLMMLDHACEMLLKAALLQRGSDIRNPKTGYAHSFETCLNKATDDGHIRFLSDDQRRMLRVLNGLRDQAQHYLVDVSEQILYTVAQSTVTLFSQLLGRLFGKTLYEHLPKRVLPISTNPPRDMQVLMDEEFSQLKKLLDCQQCSEAKLEPRLRSLVTIDRALKQKEIPVPDDELEAVKQAIKNGSNWSDVFSGIGQVHLTTDGTGINVAIHLTKKEGIPMRIVQDGEDAEATIAIRKVDDTSFYCYSAKELARRVKLTMPRVIALIRYLEIPKHRDCFKEIKIGKSRFKMYSLNALNRIKAALPNVDMDEVWRKCRPRRKKPR